jgi:hypothetical protein
MGEELKTLDREVLVFSTDVPPQDGETDEQHVEHENAHADRAAHRQQELIAAAPAVGQHAGNSGQCSNNIGVQAPTTPANHRQHRLDPEAQVIAPEEQRYVFRQSR